MTSDETVLPHGHVQFLEDNRTAIITYHHTRWFGLAKPKVRKYIGDGWVWRCAKTFWRPSLSVESAIEEIYRRALAIRDVARMKE